MRVNRSAALSASKVELLHSPYLESLSARRLRVSVSGNELYQVIGQRKRAQTLLKDLERKAFKQVRTVHFKGETVPKTPAQNRKEELLQGLRLKIRLEIEERKLRREELRDQLLQHKRVIGTQQQVLSLKEQLLEDRKLSPSQRLFRRENEPRFSENEGKRESKRRQNSVQVYVYEDLLQREKQTVKKLKEKASPKQILQLMKSVRNAKKSGLLSERTANKVSELTE
jgi:hypothetical protein